MTPVWAILIITLAAVAAVLVFYPVLGSQPTVFARHWRRSHAPASTSAEFYHAVHETLSTVIEDNATLTQVDGRVGSFMHAHRMACVRTIRDDMWHLLDDPTMTRRQFKRDIEALIRRIEEHGP